jgi:hypothetical protein
MRATEQSPQDPDEQAALGLIQASGLTLTEEERRRLTTLHRQLAAKRAALAAVELGETEPLVTVVSQEPPR